MKTSIIILNDGTDELCNLQLIGAESWEDFKNQYKELFDTYDPNTKTYLIPPNEVTKNYIFEISESDDQTELEEGILQSLGFITFRELKKNYYIKEWKL